MPLSKEQEDKLKALYERVPRQNLIVHDWRSPAGVEFQRYVTQLTTQHSIPLAWAAEAVGLPPQTLAQTLTR